MRSMTSVILAVKVVVVAYDPTHYQANKEKYAKKSLKWRLDNPDRAKENRRKYYEAHKQKEMEYSTKLNRLRRTGVTDEQYQLKLLEQEGVCAICKEVCTKALAADHCHVTGKFRGLLCNNCNRGIGHLKDSPELLENAIRYLRKD